MDGGSIHCNSSIRSGPMNPSGVTSGSKIGTDSAIQRVKKMEKMKKKIWLLWGIIKTLDLVKVLITKVKDNFVRDLVQKVMGYFALYTTYRNESTRERQSVTSGKGSNSVPSESNNSIIRQIAKSEGRIILVITEVKNKVAEKGMRIDKVDAGGVEHESRLASVESLWVVVVNNKQKENKVARKKR